MQSAPREDPTSSSAGGLGAGSVPAGLPADVAAVKPAPETAQVQEVLDLRRNPAARQGKRLRRHERREWQVPLVLLVEESSCGEAARVEIRVTTRDISAGGFGFVCQRYLHPGTVLHARLAMLAGQPIMKAVVRNCVHVSGRAHRVGAEFVYVGPGALPACS